MVSQPMVVESQNFSAGVVEVENIVLGTHKRTYESMVRQMLLMEKLGTPSTHVTLHTTVQNFHLLLG